MERTCMPWTRNGAFLASLLVVVGANYVAQIPYYLDVYYFPHGVLPKPSSVLLLGITFVWFLTGYVMAARGQRVGYWVLLSFLLAEVGFYLHGIVVRMTHGFPPFMNLPARDALLDAVFVIGYLNMLCGLYFLMYLAWHYRSLHAGQRGASATYTSHHE